VLQRLYLLPGLHPVFWGHACWVAAARKASLAVLQRALPTGHWLPKDRYAGQRDIPLLARSVMS
jgi:hypothetical protein